MCVSPPPFYFSWVFVNSHEIASRSLLKNNGPLFALEQFFAVFFRRNALHVPNIEIGSLLDLFWDDGVDFFADLFTNLWVAEYQGQINRITFAAIPVEDILRLFSAQPPNLHQCFRSILIFLGFCQSHLTGNFLLELVKVCRHTITLPVY